MYTIERSQCYRGGEISLVNFSYENYLGLLIGHGVFSVSGRVGVCQGGVYGSVCDVNWDQEDGDVICNNSFLLELGMLQIHVNSPVYKLSNDYKTFIRVPA